MNDPLVSPYRPIDCSVHDRLESLAVLRRVCAVRWTDAHGAGRREITRMVDVFARGGEEFVLLESGETVRLDRIVSFAEVDPG